MTAGAFDLGECRFFVTDFVRRQICCVFPLNVIIDYVHKWLRGSLVVHFIADFRLKWRKTCVETTDRLAQLVECRIIVSMVAGSNPGLTNTQDLK